MQLPHAETNEAQKSDEELNRLRKSSNSGLQLRNVELSISGQDFKICCNATCDRLCPYIPRKTTTFQSYVDKFLKIVKEFSHHILSLWGIVL